jgi:hypothetical protein
MARGRVSAPTDVGYSLRELADTEQPPVELDEWVARLRTAGATEVVLTSETPGGAFVEVTTADVSRSHRSVIFAKSRRVTASQEIEWKTGSTAFRNALEALVVMFQQFDKVGRFRFAASDMGLVVGAADALVDARERHGPARAYERIIETGMVVTYARPFLPSNEAGIGESWWPKDPDDRELHDELVDLRNEYHAHAGHAPHRRLENTTAIFGDDGRPMFAESWEELPAWKLRALVDLAGRLKAKFDAEAERLDVELFGPRDQL